MDTATLKQNLLEEMKLYSGEGMNGISYLTINEDAQVYAVIDYSVVKKKRIVWAALIARLVDDKIYIDVDNNYPTLFESLKARGVPENQIVLAYRQEAVEAQKES
jgi:hypothetical protein